MSTAIPVSTALARAYSHSHGKKVTATAGRSGSARSVRVGPPLDVLGTSVPWVLRTALAPRTFHPWADHNDHRAHPSARAAYAHDVDVCIGDARWRLDPVRSRLDGPAVGPPADVVTLSVTPAAWRLPDSYGALRDALALLEVGHVSAALCEAAAAAGLAADVEVGPGGVTLVLRRGSTTWPLPRVLADRSSGLGPRGLAADPRPLPSRLFDTFVADAQRVPPGSPAGALAHRLAVRNVENHADGLHEPGRLLGTGRTMTDLQDAFTLGPGEIDIGGMNVGWVISADVAGAVRTDGPGAYDRLLIACGAAAQHVCSAAALAGLFCRPVRSVDEAATESAMALDPAQDFLYLLLIGRPLVTDFAYDLSDPTPWRPS